MRCFLINLRQHIGIKLSKNTGFSITSAERYSLALFELSEENNLLSQIEDQSLSMLNLINQKLRSLMSQVLQVKPMSRKLQEVEIY